MQNVAKGRATLLIIYALVCHLSFLVSVFYMAYSLFAGLENGHGSLHGASGVVANLLLLLQFPIVHSVLLTNAGRKILLHFAPRDLNTSIATTLYVTFSSAQLIATFLLWSPSHILLFELSWPIYWISVFLFLISWPVLALSMIEAGPQVQFGWLGWWSNLKRIKPTYPSFAQSGLHRIVRHPIYSSFFCILLFSPIWNLDHLLIIIVWGSYCLVGPLKKERRYQQYYGEAYLQYKNQVPYFIPKFPGA